MTLLVSLLFLPVLGLLVLAIVGVVMLVNRARFSVPGATGADARVLRNYLHTFSRTLSTLGVSRSARRRHVDELKANLADAAAADGVASALQGLGPAGALATGYADYRPRPAWVMGVGAALGTWLVTLFISFQLGGAFSDGLTDAVGLGGGPLVGNGARTNAFAVTFEWVSRAGGEVDVHVITPWVWILPLAAFFVASRSWRALSLRNAATVSE